MEIDVKYRFLTLLLMLALAVCFLTACKNDAGVPDGGNTSSSKKKEEPQAPSIPDLELDVNSLAAYKIVCENVESAAALTLKTGIKNAVGADIATVSKSEAASEYEILIGKTGREESDAMYLDMRHDDYAIEVKGSKIVIGGGSEESLSAAVEYFLSLIKDSKIVLKGDYNYKHNGEYEVNEVKINGVSLGAYRIIYKKPHFDVMESVDKLHTKIFDKTGYSLFAASQNIAETKYEIVLGETTRRKMEPCSYYSYEVFYEDGKIYINGFDLYAIDQGIKKFTEMLSAGGNLTPDKLKYTYEHIDRSQYIDDIDKLYMRWEDEWEPDPRMLDYNGKIAAYRNVSDRLLTCAHRADGYYYPENSIESIISFYKMGGDVVELDIQATKDGVLILMHDNTLERMTNWSEVKGKTVNGITLPTSNNVCDWTYAQIQQLYLREAKGKSAVTTFKVPTLTEALKVCKGRLLIIPDKTDKWSYIPDGSGKPDLFSCMKEANNYESILISYGFTNDPSGAVNVQKYIYERSGVRPLLMVRSDSNPVKYVYDPLVQQAPAGSFAVQVGGTFNQSTFPSKFQSAYKTLKGKVLMWGWTIGDVDDTGIWQEMYDLGYRMIMTNNYLELVKFAAKKIK